MVPVVVNPMIYTVLRHGVPILVIAAVLLAAYFHGVGTTTREYEAILAQRDAENALATADAVKEVRRLEQAATAYVAGIDQLHREALENEVQSRDRTIADLHAGAAQLRSRFTCPAAADLPGAANSTGSGDEAGEGGLQAADGEFLVRLAAEADAVVLQLQACQAIVSGKPEEYPSRRWGQ